MKKFLAVVLATFCFNFVGCGMKEKDEQLKAVKTFKVHTLAEKKLSMRVISFQYVTINFKYLDKDVDEKIFFEVRHWDQEPIPVALKLKTELHFQLHLEDLHFGFRVEEATDEYMVISYLGFYKGKNSELQPSEVILSNTSQFLPNPLQSTSTSQQSSWLQ